MYKMNAFNLVLYRGDLLICFRVQLVHLIDEKRMQIANKLLCFVSLLYIFNSTIFILTLAFLNLVNVQHRIRR